MSDAPRTDAVIAKHSGILQYTDLLRYCKDMTTNSEQLESELNEAKKVIESLKKLESAQDTLKLISVADWKTSGELRKMARDAWEKGSNND